MHLTKTIKIPVFFKKKFIPIFCVTYAKYLLGKIYLEDSARMDVAKSIKLLESSAFFDNPFAEFLLFEFYNDGRFISKDAEKAFFYLYKSIKNEYNKALYHYGLICCNKYSPLYNIKEAKLSFKKAAILGDYDALYQLGLLYYAEIDNKKKIKKLFSSLEFCAEQNNPNACYYLGMIYYNKDNKKNVSRDSKKSIKYLEQALKLNHPNASTLLGVIYYEDIEVVRDIPRSIYYLSLAPYNIYSQYNLGYIYYKEKSLKKDIYQVIDCLSFAANGNDSEAQYLLGLIYSDNKYIPIDINKSISYLTDSANQDNPDAQFHLGLIYYEGTYVERNIEKAIYYFEQSSRENNSEASFYLGFIYFDNQFIERDIKKSFFYLDISSKNHNPNAIFLIGLILQERLLPYSFQDIMQYYKEASNCNCCFAQNNLGVIYKIGFKVDKNMYVSIDYFKKSIKNAKDDYSIFNLARIYYFGDYDEDIIDNLKISSNANFLFADLFLFYIYLFGIKEQMRNEKKAKKYFIKINYNYEDKRVLEIVNEIYESHKNNPKDDHKFASKLGKFFEEYNLIYSLNHSEIDDFIYFYKNGDFKKNIFDNLPKDPPNEEATDVNTLFYEGLNSI